MIEAIEGVDHVVVQNQIMYDEILEKLRPDYIIHGDNWKTGSEKSIRDNVVSLLSRYGGELIEVGFLGCTHDFFAGCGGCFTVRNKNWGLLL